MKRTNGMEPMREVTRERGRHTNMSSGDTSRLGESLPSTD